MKKKILVLCGPTASGKSYLGHKIAKNYDAEIVNIDSMQIYQEIPIITASPPENYKTELPYHLYNFLSITEEFSVVKYLQLAAKKIHEISNRDKLTILIGGTGLYINSLLYGYNIIPEISLDLRKQVRELHSRIGSNELWSKLKELDPLAASKINQRDSQRLLRAYEVFLQTGKSIYFFQDLPKKTPLPEFDFKVIFLLPKRDFLYQICNQRLHEIFKEGAIDEIAALKKTFPACDYLNLKAVGVKELLSYLNGEITLNEALILAQARTRQYAKRQITWFTHQLKEKRTFEYSNEDEFKSKCEEEYL